MTAQARTPGALHHVAHFVVGFLSRPCCSIPAALALLGAGGTGIAAAIAPWRIWFMAAAVMFFSVSFYWNLIRNQNQAGMIVWGLSLVLAGSLWILPLAAASLRLQPTLMADMANESSTQTTIEVRGMACKACARRIEHALEDADGVHEAVVSFDAGTATVRHDPHRITVASLEELIRGCSFIVGNDSKASFDKENSG